MDVTQLILDLAGKLNTIYRVKENPARLLGDNELAKALADLADEEPVLKRLINVATTVATPDIVTKALSIIELIQKNTGALTVDGFFGKGSLKDFLTRNVGHFPHDRVKPRQTPPADGNLKAIVYYVRSLPKVQLLDEGEVLERLERAMNSWRKVIVFEKRQTGNEPEANLIVSVGPLPPPFNLKPSVVAVADQGPPNGSQLSLIFDETEDTWTEKFFIATAAHEFGHILGLEHLNGNGPQLMNTTVREDVRSPRDADLAAALQLGWKKATG